MTKDLFLRFIIGRCHIKNIVENCVIDVKCLLRTVSQRTRQTLFCTNDSILFDGFAQRISLKAASKSRTLCTSKNIFQLLMKEASFQTRYINEGGYGFVIQAYDKKWNQWVAIKFLSRQRLVSNGIVFSKSLFRIQNTSKLRSSITNNFIILMSFSLSKPF